MSDPSLKEHRDKGDLAVAPLLFRAALFLTIAFTILLSLRLTLGPAQPESSVLTIILAYAMFALTMIMARRNIQVRLVTHVMLIGLAGLVLFRSYVAGGPASPVMMVTIILPVAATFLLGRAAGLGYLIVSALSIVGFVALRLYNGPFPSIALSPLGQEVIQSSVIVFVMSVCTWIALLYSQHNETLTKTLLDQTQQDYLTGIANRRALDSALQTEIVIAKRQVRPLSLIMVDLDHFKKFNDLYGHHQGDQCLIRVATIIKTCLRGPGDMVARYGGEEFAVILPDTSVQQAKELAETIRHAVLGLNIEHRKSPYGAVSITLGASELDILHNMDAKELLRDADNALYQGKEAGRNRVEATDLIRVSMPSLTSQVA